MRLEDLIVRFLANELSEEEITALQKQLKEDVEYRKKFKEYTGIQYDLDMALLPIDGQEAFGKMEAKIKESSKYIRRNRWKPLYKYAAIICLVGCLAYLGQNWFGDPNSVILPTPKSTSITLELDGQVQEIEPTEIRSITNLEGKVIGKQSQGKLQYTDTTAATTLEYNTLYVPYGQKFQLVLADGSEVYLNAGTTITYPIRFLNTGKREVFIHGEAFLDVAHDDQLPFVVHSDKAKVLVLGTRFNVSNYPEEDNISVTLINGKVQLDQSHSRGYETTLLPGMQGSLSKETGIVTQQKIDTTQYTAWMENELVFKKMAFKNIVAKLERYYNIPIVNNNKSLDEEIFIASFKNKTLEEVLQFFNDTYDLEYKVKDGVIVIQ